MFAYQESRIRCVRAPAHGTIEEGPVCELGQEGLDSSLNGPLGLIGVGVGGVFGV
jgi:hypothetical protein